MSRSSRQCFNLRYCLNTFTSIVQQVVTCVASSPALTSLFLMVVGLPFARSGTASMDEKIWVERLESHAPPPYNSQLTIYKNSASRPVEAYVKSLKAWSFRVEDNVEPRVITNGLTVNCPPYFNWQIDPSAQTWVSLFKAHLNLVNLLCESLRNEEIQLTKEHIIFGVVVASLLNMMMSDTKKRTKYLLKFMLSIVTSGLTFLAGVRLAGFTDVSESYALLGVSVVSGLLSGYTSRKINQAIDYCYPDQSEQYSLLPRTQR